MGVAANWQGADQRSSLKSAIAFGLLRQSDAPVSAKSRGQEYVAGSRVWIARVDRASKNAKAAYYGLSTGPYDAFDNIRSRCGLTERNAWTCRSGRRRPRVEWGVGRDGIVPFVSTLNDERAAVLPWHNWAKRGWKMINGEPYLLAKVWQGKNIGDYRWL
jgi:hypothetical protein